MVVSYLKEVFSSKWARILLCVCFLGALFIISLSWSDTKILDKNPMSCARGYCSDEVKKAKESDPEGIWKPTVFTKIINREIKVDIIYEDDKTLAWKDIAPKAPVHFLVIPKRQIPRLQDTEDSDQELLGHLMLVVRKVAKQQGLNEDGYRVVINNGQNGAQSVFHLHIHVFGGRQMGWPPG